jgi:hypothetical protein
MGRESMIRIVLPSNDNCGIWPTNSLINEAVSHYQRQRVHELQLVRVHEPLQHLSSFKKVIFARDPIKMLQVYCFTIWVDSFQLFIVAFKI